jgi:hypothetical protein
VLRAEGTWDAWSRKWISFSVDFPFPAQNSFNTEPYFLGAVAVGSVVK